MILLTKLQSETGLFDTVTFKKGINIIKGVYHTLPEENSELNGIGKSTLIRLIDFCLLSDSSKQRFSVTKRAFLKGHSVTLEIDVDGKSHNIKRSFENPDKVFYWLDDKQPEEYTESEMKEILATVFYAKDSYNGIFEPTWFRDITKFFVKDDINHFQRNDPLAFINPFKTKYEMYSYNLFLMGITNTSVTRYADLSKEDKSLSKQRKKIINKVKEDTGKTYQEISSELRILDDKIKSLEIGIKEYNFIDTYKEVEVEIVTVSNVISEYLKDLTMYQRKLQEYKNSYKIDMEFDKDKVLRIYQEVSTTLVPAIKKQLDDVISFRKRLSENRMKFLQNKEHELEALIKELSIKIADLEKKRSNLYKILDQKEALDSIKNSYEVLLKDRSKKERLEMVLVQIKDIDQKKYQLNEDITEAVRGISDEISSVSEKFDNISDTFFEIVKYSIKSESLEEVVFDVVPQPELNSPLKITVDVPKSEALGKGRFKILAYDLAVFLNIVFQKRSLPTFLIHDGVFHGIDIKTIVRVLNLVNSKFLQEPTFQYIITLNENEYSVPEDKKSIYGNYDFDVENAIIVSYSDKPTEMIFKQEF